MSAKSYREQNFEDHVTERLAAQGYRLLHTHDYDRDLVLIPSEVVAFVRATQPDAYDRLHKQYGDDTDRNLALRVSAEVKKYGTLHVLRKGIKDRGVKVLMIGFGEARSASCEKGARRPRPPWVRDFLAEAASPTDSGTPSRAETDCSSTVERTNENTDGDYYFCAATGSELSSIFATAINTVTEGIRLVELP